MDADASTANGDDSRKGLGRRLGALPTPSTAALRVALALVVLAGCLLLAVSTFMTVAQTRVLTTSELAIDVDTTRTGWDLHGPAMILVALFAVAMLAGTLRGARPAMVALVAAGVGAVIVTGAIDSGKLDDTGSLALQYEGVSAGAETGFHVETLGAVMLLAGAGGLLALGLPGAARLGGGVGSPRLRGEAAPTTTAAAVAPATPAAPVAPAASRRPVGPVAPTTPAAADASPAAGPAAPGDFIWDEESATTRAAEPAPAPVAPARSEAGERVGSALGAAAGRARAARERRAAARAAGARQKAAEPKPSPGEDDPPASERPRSVRDRMR